MYPIKYHKLTIRILLSTLIQSGPVMRMCPGNKDIIQMYWIEFALNGVHIVISIYMIPVKYQMQRIGANWVYSLVPRCIGSY